MSLKIIRCLCITSVLHSRFSQEKHLQCVLCQKISTDCISVKFDQQRKGMVNIHEFGALFSCINQWKATFESIDQDRSCYIDEMELSRAFQLMGYQFSPMFVQNLLSKYDARKRRLTLDNFIVCCVEIQRLTNSFRCRDLTCSGQATLNYEDFLGIALGAHN